MYGDLFRHLRPIASAMWLYVAPTVPSGQVKTPLLSDSVPSSKARACATVAARPATTTTSAAASANRIERVRPRPPAAEGSRHVVKRQSLLGHCQDDELGHAHRLLDAVTLDRRLDHRAISARRLLDRDDAEATADPPTGRNGRREADPVVAVVDGPSRRSAAAPRRASGRTTRASGSRARSSFRRALRPPARDRRGSTADRPSRPQTRRCAPA